MIGTKAALKQALEEQGFVDEILKIDTAEQGIAFFRTKGLELSRQEVENLLDSLCSLNDEESETVVGGISRIETSRMK